MKNIIFAVQIIAYLSCTSMSARDYSSSEDNLSQSKDQSDGYTIIHTFQDDEGKELGKAYVKYDTLETFSEMIISRKSHSITDTLYHIDSRKLIGEKGLEEVISGNDFYGYTVVLKKSDYIVIVLVDGNGEGASDNITIKWNKEKDTFELLRLP